MSSADRRVRAQLVLGGLRWRAGASVAMFLVAVAAIGAGTFGPIYLGEADHSVLLTTLAAVPVGNSGLTLLPTRGSEPRTRLEQAAGAESRAFDGKTFFARPIVTENVTVHTTSTTTGQNYGTDLVARTGVCAELTFTSGACPRSPESVAMSIRSARALGLHTGDPLRLALPKTTRPLTLTISGLFRPGNPLAPQWWGTNLFTYGFGTPAAPLLDDVFAVPATLDAVPAGQLSFVAQQPLEPTAVASQGVGGFESALSRFENRVGAYRVTASSQVVSILAGAVQGEHTATTIAVVVDLQLVLLALLVLYFVAARTAEARDPDVRLAELRGFPRGDAAVVALLEPLTVLGVAVPVGVVVAWLAARLATPHLFVTAVTPTIGLVAIGAALLSFAAGVAATVLGAGPALFGHRATQRRTGRGSVALAVDAVAVTLAAAAFVEVAAAGVSHGSHTDPLAAFGPGLLAFGVGVLGARLLPVVSRSAISVTRNSRWVSSSVVIRRVARRLELSRHIVLMSLCIGLALFAISGWSIAGHNRTLRAGFDVGASQVLTVQTRPGVDLLTAVRRADPTGTKAMAVVIERAPDGDVMAVDASRLARVSAWPTTLGATDVSSVAHLIAPRTAPTVTVSGQNLRLSVDVLGAATPPPELQAVVFDDAYQAPTTLDLGPLVADNHTYQASLAGDCPGSCRLVSLGLVWTPSGTAPQQQVTFAVRMTAMADQSATGSWAVLKAGLATPGAWAADATGVTVVSGPSGLTVNAMVDADGSAASFGPADVPRRLPAVVTGPTTDAVGLDGTTIPITAAVTISALPVIGNANSATMVDLPLVERLQSGPMIDTTSEVWLAPGAGAAIVQRLRHQGLVVLAVRSEAARATLLAKGGSSLAYDLFLLAAVAAGVLAVGVTIFVVSVTARRRSVELASLRAVGISRQTLRRSLALEHLLVLGVGVAGGVAAGVIATVVALPSMPENFAPGPGPPLDYTLPLATLGVVLLAIVVALAVAVSTTDRLVVNRASVESLGGDQ